MEAGSTDIRTAVRRSCRKRGAVGKMQLFRLQVKKKHFVTYKTVYSDIAQPLFFLTAF